MTEKEINAIYYKMHELQKEIDELKESRINDLESIADCTIKLEEQINRLKED